MGGGPEVIFLDLWSMKQEAGEVVVWAPVIVGLQSILVRRLRFVSGVNYGRIQNPVLAGRGKIPKQTRVRSNKHPNFGPIVPTNDHHDYTRLHRWRGPLSRPGSLGLSALTRSQKKVTGFYFRWSVRLRPVDGKAH